MEALTLTLMILQQKLRNVQCLTARMFIAVLSIVAKNKITKCSIIENWLNQLCTVHKMPLTYIIQLYKYVVVCTNNNMNQGSYFIELYILIWKDTSIRGNNQQRQWCLWTLGTH